MARQSITGQYVVMAGYDSVTPVHRGRPRDPVNDTAILHAALDLLIDRGAAGTSIEGVARQAGVAKLTVYRRWTTKEDLLMAAMEFSRSDDLTPPSPGQSIDDIVEFVAELLSRPRFRMLMTRVIGASVDYPKLLTTYTERYLAPRLESLAETALEAIDDGRFPPETDPTVIQDVLSSAIGFSLLHGTDVTAEQISQRLHILLKELSYRSEGR